MNSKPHSVADATDTRLVDIIIVTYNSASTIEKCIESIATGGSPDHFITIVDNDSRDNTVGIVQGLAQSNARIRLVTNSHNAGFTRACNQGIELSAQENPSGRFVILLNPDTIVSDGWMQRLLEPLHGDTAATGPVSNYVAALQKYDLYLPKGMAPRKVDMAGLANMLAEANGPRTVETKLLIGFCLAMRRDLIQQHGPLDADLFLGNDDLEYSLRMRTLGYKLKVVPACFVYHEGQKSFQSLPSGAAGRLVQESTDCLRLKLEQTWGRERVPSPMELWGIDWFTPTPMDPVVSIVIPVWNNVAFTSTCIKSIAAYTGVPHEVIVVDNGSTDGTPQFLSTQPHIRVIRNEKNLGFAAASNQGMRIAQGRHILLLNNDVVVTPHWLDGMLYHIEDNPSAGIVGPRTNFAAGAQQLPSVGYKSIADLEQFATGFRIAHLHERTVVPRIIGLCMLIRGECFKQIGLLDEQFGMGNFEDDDYCVRARLAGFECVIAGDVFVHHFGSQTFKIVGVDFKELLETNRRKFMNKWKGVVPGAPSPAATH